MGVLDFLKNLINKKETNKYDNEIEDNNKYEGLNVKELYYKGKEYWLNGENEEAVECFKRGIDKQDQQNPYSYACLAIYYYEIAPEGSECGEAKEYNKVMSWGGAHVRQSSKSDPLVLYCLGDVAAKLGTTEDTASAVNPFYEAVYRYLGLLLYQYIIGSQKELTKKLDEMQEVSISEKQKSLMHSERAKAKKLPDAEKGELTLLKKGNLIDDGLIQHLILDIHSYPESQFKQLQKSMNQEDILLPMVLFCSLISEARLEGLKGLK